MNADTEYLLALAEEMHLAREHLYQERRLERRRQRRADLCAHLRHEIKRLIEAPFSWQARG